ncbi:MAG: cytochrome c biogenesis protein CcdA [Ruminococcaceae bacterium]|nr:cytochrome c biogenesis protein CcdA [Oscillospiraceae bacterium]
MTYVIAFLEGMITFISPCLLPMLPIYVSYFAGGGERSTGKTLKCALGFVLGFTAVFAALGALAGTVGSFLREYRTAVDIVLGSIVIFFGLHFLGVFKFTLFHGSRRRVDTQNMGFFSAVLFGVVFSVGWTPCVGAFLGSALALASQQAHMVEGLLMLLAYSLGLGIPFVISAVLIEYLKSAFNWIKKNYKVINAVSGGLLVLLGVLMATGLFGRLLAGLG